MLAAAICAGCEKEQISPAAPPRGTGEFMVPGTFVPPGEDAPDADGWQSESLSAAITRELKAFAGRLVAGEAVAKAAGPIVDGAFEGAHLRPASWTEVTVSGGLKVLEPSAEMGEVEGFAEAVDAMLRDAGFAQLLERAEVKVVAVGGLEDSRVECEVLFHFGGRGEGDTRRQLDARWNTVWSVGRDGACKLVRVRGSGPLAVSRLGVFSDVTHAAFGAIPGFPAQFYRGQDHWAARVEMLSGLDVGGWQGLAVADVDGDGWDDIYVAQPGGLPNRLFLAEGDGTFVEGGAAAGVDFLDSSHANLLIDLDNDGDQDLLAGVSHGILMMENDGSGRFQVRGVKLLPAAIPYSITSADIDNDGDLDFYVCCYNRRPGVNRHHVFARPVPYHDADNGGRNALFRNSGDWRFDDATVSSGMDVNNRRFSYAAAWEDYDNDGDADLYVANDFGRNCLYRNDTEPGGAPRFEEVAELAGVVDIGAGMSACWGDYDDDGMPDLYVGNMFSSAGHRVTAQRGFHRGADAETRESFRRHARGNSLFANRGRGRFEDRSLVAGVSRGRWAWASKFADLDCDGRLDLLVANGFISQRSPDDL